MTGSTEILKGMVEADGYIEVVRGPTDQYITVCRPDGTALFAGLLPSEILDGFKAAWFVKQDGPENDRGVSRAEWPIRPAQVAGCEFQLRD